ncbi:MAG: phosphatidylserine decarboxylase [Wigglesworthia glossinidia]|nr:phosphatidylserine decarboxylase [Wigglesworthia glossinidia]
MYIILQKFLPKFLITKCIGWIAECKCKILVYLSILIFIKIYKINIKELKILNLKSYSSFNEFFSRKINMIFRPINLDPTVIICPADGILTQFGYFEDTQTLQIKNHGYTVQSLLAENEKMVELFKHGIFFTTYLSPKNYHRVHMPCDGVLIKMLYIPGQLFSVHKKIFDKIPNIFSKNERVICLFNTKFGPMIQILVGSIICGTIFTTWYGKVTPPREGIIKLWNYSNNLNQKIFLKKGDEMGFFALGSTVITIFIKENILLGENLHAYDAVRIGNILAYGIQNKK